METTVESRVCRRCGTEKPIAEFRPCPSPLSGKSHEYACRPCESAETAARRRRDREKVSAWNAVYRALRRGALRREPCEDCGRTDDVEAHHDDYARPLDVRWLCPLHHGAATRIARGGG